MSRLGARLRRFGRGSGAAAQGPTAYERARLARQPTDWPLSCYLICGLPRTGTGFLAGLLSSTGLVGHAREFFGPKKEPPWAADRFGDYVAFVTRLQARNGVFGATVHRSQLEHVIARLRAAPALPTASRDDHDLLERAFPSVRYIWIRRSDLVAQAVSWCKADQTGVWSSEESRGKATRPVFDFDAIHERVCLAQRRNEVWRTWFTANGIEPFSIVYEDLVADSVGLTREALSFLGVSVPPSATVRATLARQADAVNAEWIARYRELAELRSSQHPAIAARR